MEGEVKAKWRMALLPPFVWAWSVAMACSSDPSSTNAGAGGAIGASGSAGAGGKGSGGALGSGGRGSGGGVGSGGKGSGGTGGGDAILDGGTDAHRPACPVPKILVYEAPGCDGVSTPVCALPDLDACDIDVCGCDGTTLSGCGDYAKPYRHKGACGDASIPDSGSDAH